MEKKIRIARLGSIFLLNIAIKEVIDLVLNTILMIRFGYIVSLFTTTLIYVLFGIISVKIYDYYKKDCLMIEDLKESQHNGNLIQKENRLIRLIEKLARKNKTLLSLILSFKNPGLTVIYYRDGFHLYNGFTGKNIKTIFLVNSIIINIYWNTILYTGFSMWETIKTVF